MRRWASWVAASLIGGIGAVLLLLSSPYAASVLERRLVELVEEHTGTKVSLEDFSFDWRRGLVAAGPVIVRGLEAPDEAPLFRAAKLEVDLSIESLFQPSLQLESLVVDRPEVNVIVAPDGTTNIPTSGGDTAVAETLVNLAVGQLSLNGGEARINEQRIPLDLRARGIQALINFDSASRSYRGSFDIGQLEGAPLPVSLESKFSLSASGFHILEAAVKTPASRANLSGSITNWQAPNIEIRAETEADLAELARAARQTYVHRGTAAGTLTATMSPGGAWQVTGPVSFRNVDISVGAERVRGVAGRGELTVTAARTDFRQMVVEALDGRFSGNASIVDNRSFDLAGTIANIEVPGDIAARVSGPIRLAGSLSKVTSGSAKLQLVPVSGPVPVGGSINAELENSKLRLGDSQLRLGGSRLQISGALDTQLSVDLETSNLDDLLPAARLLSADVPAELPVSLEGRRARFRGYVHGTTEAPQLDGELSAAALRFQEQTIENVRSRVSATPSHLHLQNWSFARRDLSATGSVRVPLADWTIDRNAPLSGDVQVKDAALARLNQDFRIVTSEIDGTGSAEAKLSGTIADPRVEGSIRVARGSFEGERFDLAHAEYQASRNHVQISGLEITRGRDRIRGSGEWNPDRLTLDAEALNWDIGRHVPIGEPVMARGVIRGTLRKNGDRWNLVDLDSTWEARARDAGLAELRASSAAGTLRLDAQAQIYGASLAAQSRWKLEPGLPGSGFVQLLSLDENVLERATKSASPLPFVVRVAGTANIEGPLLEPSKLTGRATLSDVRLTPKQQNLPGGISASDLTVRNDGPVRLRLSPEGVAIERASLVAKDTNIEALGSFASGRNSPLNFVIRGQVNLATLSTFRSDIVSSGRSTLNVRLRGSLKQPDVDGRLSFTNASLGIRDFPNGLTNVNGAVLFDSSRASIESMNAQSGGGTVSLTGYVGFGVELAYQLQAFLSEVRVRYPEGISTQANAALTLTGSSRRSMLSGTITVLRTALLPTTDAGGLLASPSVRASLTSTPTSDFLRGLHFDLKVETSQSAEFTTQLTKNVEADGDLRVRGTFARPIVLGRISITQGAVQFFGTDYTINRGEINFVNPVSIEPQVDLDLETRVRGINVSIMFSGPLNKLNMTYRSDPPLQSSEILALLAVGRTPTAASTTSLGGSSTRTNDLLGGGGTAVLNSALSQGGSGGQLQRFFGVTRLKIDPQLIGLDNTPQSRLSFEQPISRNVTVTYVQTLARAQSQLVRVQWDLSREWSALATRDENGVLSIDFVFRKSFK